MKQSNVTVEKLKVTKPEVKSETVEATPAPEKSLAEKVGTAIVSALSVITGKNAEKELPGVPGATEANYEAPVEKPEDKKEEADPANEPDGDEKEECCPHCGAKMKRAEEEEEDKKMEVPEDKKEEKSAEEAEPEKPEDKKEEKSAEEVLPQKAETSPDLSIAAWHSAFGFNVPTQAQVKQDWKKACESNFDGNAYKQ